MTCPCRQNAARHRRGLTLALSAILAGALLALSLFVMDWRTDADDRFLCQAQNDSRLALGGFIDLFEAAVNENPPMSEKEQARADKFFADARALVAPLDCDRP